jgi:hypothetical protein
VAITSKELVLILKNNDSRFNLQTEVRPGTLSLFKKAWAAAKQAAGLSEQRPPVLDKIV